MITGISHVVLSVRDLPASRATYAGILGLPERATGVDQLGRPACALSVGPSLLELHQEPAARPALDETTGEPLTSMYDNRCWVGHFAFPMVDAFGRQRELAARGIAWTCDPSDQPAGLHLIRRRLLEFTDPNYLTVQFAERIDEEGNPIPPAHTDYQGQPWPGCDRFDHIMLNTPDMDAKRAFCMGILGLDASAPQHTRLGVQCDLTAGVSVIELIWREAAQPPLHAGTIASLGLFVADLDAAYSALRERGTSVTAPKPDTPVTGLHRRIIAVTDPDGLTLELVEAS